jgi:hypothetical protein
MPVLPETPQKPKGRFTKNTTPTTRSTSTRPTDPSISDIKKALGLVGSHHSLIYRKLRLDIKASAEQAGITRKNHTSDTDWNDLMHTAMKHPAFASTKDSLFAYDHGDEEGFQQAYYNIYMLDLLVQDAIKKDRESKSKLDRALQGTMEYGDQHNGTTCAKRTMMGNYKLFFILLA